jgi:hypothetical protein
MVVEQPAVGKRSLLNKNRQHEKKRRALVTSEQSLLASSPCLSRSKQKVLKLKSAAGSSRAAPNFKRKSFAKCCDVPQFWCKLQFVQSEHRQCVSWRLTKGQQLQDESQSDQTCAENKICCCVEVKRGGGGPAICLQSELFGVFRDKRVREFIFKFVFFKFY